MRKPNPGYLFAWPLFLFAGCASTSKTPVDPNLPSAAEVAAQEKTQSESIHVECSIYYVGESSGTEAGCKSVDFALEDADGVEIARMNPDRKGKIDFPVPAEKAFRIVPKVPSAWTIEIIPPGDLHRGESVRVILRR
jgi:hypothetical protein